MIRTRQEWYDYCMARGTSGDQVYQILKDWKDSDGYILQLTKEQNELTNKLTKELSKAIISDIRG